MLLVSRLVGYSKQKQCRNFILKIHELEKKKGLGKHASLNLTRTFRLLQKQSNAVLDTDFWKSASFPSESELNIGLGSPSA